MTKPLLLVTAIALIDTHGHVLLAQRPADKHMAGLWEFPGGKVHAGETPEAALIREMKEELDLTVRAENLRPLTFASYDYRDFHLLMPLFGCHQWVGTARPLEGQTLAWVHPRDFDAYQMPPADEPLAVYLRKIS